MSHQRLISMAASMTFFTGMADYGNTNVLNTELVSSLTANVCGSFLHSSGLDGRDNGQINRRFDQH